MQRKNVIRIGGGSAHEADDVYPAKDMAENGALDYLVFDCQSEVALSKAFTRLEQGGVGYDNLFETKLRIVLPACAKNGIKIIANAGIIDPAGAATMASRVAKELGCDHLKIIYVTGGEVSDALRQRNPDILELGKPLSSLGNAMLGAVAYGGAKQIVDALDAGADIVITPRAGDSAQYLAAMVHAFGWSFTDWDKIGQGLGIGHILECSAQVSGGCYADPGKKSVEGLDRLGFPIAEVSADGSAIITKIPGTGGVINEQTCKEQIVYEIGDPTTYLHSDGVVDFSETRVTQVGENRVRVEGTRGKPKPLKVKVGLAVKDGYVGVGRLLFGGVGAYDKAQLAAETVTNQLVARHGIDRDAIRVDYIGYNALFDWGLDPSSLREIELRVSGRFATKAEAAQVVAAIALLPCNGPAGIFWPRPADQGTVEEITGYYSTLLDSGDVRYAIHEVA